LTPDRMVTQSRSETLEGFGYVRAY